MRKNRENVRKTIFLIYAVLGISFWFPSAGFCGVEEARFGIIEALEQSIHALVDPFIPKIAKPPVRKVEVVVPVPVEAPVEIEPVIEEPPAPVRPQAPALSLTGIIYNPKRPMAIINGEIVEPRDTISIIDAKEVGEKKKLGKAVITTIEKSTVEILYMGETFIFTMDQGE